MSINLGNNTFYEGQMIDGKKYGFGRLIKDGNLLYEGMWIDDKKIDDIPLPNEVLPNTNTNMETCQKLKFSYNSKNGVDNFDLTYYVPFSSLYELDKVIDKAIKQTELTEEHNQINITVDNTECDLTDCITVASSIDELAFYIAAIDFNCSSCIEFNRLWTCCGQFAPFMYMYSFLLFEGNYDRYENKFGHTGIQKPSQIYNIANVFYKIFSSYARNNDKYIEHRQNVGDIYGIYIPNVFDDLGFWLDEETNNIGFHTDANLLHFENNKSYLILLCDNTGVNHYCYIYKCNDYVIICDSWTDYYQRFPITRIMDYNEFIKCIIKINTLYKSYDDESMNDESITDEILLLYNFIIDALFLVPYSKEHINQGKQSFTERDLSYIVVIDPNKIVDLLDTLVEETGTFNMYLQLGGSKKRRKMTIKNKKGKKGKKGKSKKSTNKKR